MEVNMQRESGEFQQTSCSVDGQFLVAFRKMMKKEVDIMVIKSVHQVVLPIIGDLVRNVVKEEIQSAQMKLSEGIRNCANATTVSRERSLQLKFSDEVSLPVLTGKVLIGKTSNPMMVSLIDSTTGEVVDCEPESSAKVELLLLDASDDDQENNWSFEDFNNRIISEDDKKKPHLAKNAAKYIRLENGVGNLWKLKLGHDKHWMKDCKCRLGARVVENFRCHEVKEALTESFVVSDSRSKLYDKHHPPLLLDELWRLDYIGKDGAPCQRLNKQNIRTVQDFLFLHKINPQRLQEIFGAVPKTWKGTVDHARSCTIDDEKLYLHHPSAESKMSVVFDAVGGLKGLVVNQSHYAPIDNLSAEEKDYAHDLLLSAFENREERTSFDDEASLLHQFPYRPSDINDCNLMIAENINNCFPTEPGSSSLSTTPYIMASDLHDTINHCMDTNNLSVPIQLPSSSHETIYQSGSVESPGTRQLNESIQSSQFSHVEYINWYDPTCEGTLSQSMNFGFGNPGSPTTGLLLPLEADSVFDTWDPTSLSNTNTNGRSETLSHDRYRAFRLVGRVVNAKLWVVRAKKRKRFMGLGGMPALKKQMT